VHGNGIQDIRKEISCHAVSLFPGLCVSHTCIESFTAGRLVKTFMLAETTDANSDLYQNGIGRS